MDLRSENRVFYQVLATKAFSLYIEQGLRSWYLHQVARPVAVCDMPD